MEQGTRDRFDFDPLTFDLDDDHEVVELLVGDLHCPLCGCAYDPAETRMIRERADAVTLAVQCHCCGTGSLVTLQREAKPAETELTPVERAFFAYLSPLSDADVQSARQLLQRHTGNLRDLL